MARMELAAGSRDPAAWKEIRRVVSAANAVDTEDPEPLILFYESFLRQGMAPTANAVQGLNYAYTLAPQDRDLRMQVARQYLVDGKSKEARDALSPIAFDPHGGDMGKVATVLIGLIDRGSAAEALKEWRRLEQEQEKAAS
jgi:Flp pilus assembly protein TadD